MTLRAAPTLLLPQVLLLLGIGLVTDWGPTGWAVAIATTIVLDVLVVLGMRHHRTDVLGPPDLVTIARATLTCAVTALVVESFLAGALIDSSRWTTAITVLAAVSLAFDLVDGWVARRTGTSTPFGAQADGEADAALMLVLTVWVAPAIGWWVLSIGLARYAFAMAGWSLPWLRVQLPPRYWRKVVTAVTSVALVVATAGVVPSPIVDVLLVIALALIAESFGRDIWWSWRHRGRHEDALQRARQDAYGVHEFVDQQGFMAASEIRALATAADIGRTSRVLDLCCGRGGPGRLIARDHGCDLLGIDASPSAVASARAQAGDLSCRYEVGQVPDLPDEPVDVVLLLETMLAFRDKETLLREVRATLTPSGRFAFTIEEGEPLTQQERAVMPASDTVWPIPLSRLHEMLEQTGFVVTWQQDRSRAHVEVVDSLLTQLTAHESAIAAQIGGEPLERLLTSHRLWSDWLRTGRIRKFAIVATPRDTGSGRTAQPGHRSDSA